MSPVARLFRKRRTPLLIGLVLAIGGAFALSTLRAKNRPEAPVALVVAVPVHADGDSGDPELSYPAEVAARYANSMSFRVPGKLIERRVRLGDSVHQGQIVARLDASDAEKQLAAAQAAFDAAEHRLAFAKRQLERDTAVRAEKLIAASQLEQTQDAYSSALGARDQASDQLVLARNNLAYCTLRADHDGLITSENADTGQVLTAGQPVFGLAWTGETDIILDVAPSDVGHISVGQSAIVTFAALAGRRLNARVREVSPAADPQSRTYRVKLTLSEADPSVRLGMTGNAALSYTIAGAGQSFTVPATALFHRGQEPALWVVRPSDSTLELRPVAVRTYGERSVVIAGGLRAGEVIVQAGVHTVYAGEHVKAIKPLFDDEHEEIGGAIALASASHPGAMR